MKWIEFLRAAAEGFGIVLLGIAGCGSAWWMIFRREQLEAWLKRRRAPQLEVAMPWMALYGLILGIMLTINWGWVEVHNELASFLVIASILFPFGMVYVTRQMPLRFWNLRLADVPSYLKISGQALFWMIAPLYLLATVCDWLCSLGHYPMELQPAVEIMQNAQTLSRLIEFVVLTIGLAPIWEEIVFRGTCYPMLKARLGDRAALYASSIFFALLHGHLPTLLPLAAFGIVLTLIYEATGSLGYSIAFHALFNGFSSFFLWAFR